MTLASRGAARLCDAAVAVRVLAHSGVARPWSPVRLALLAGTLLRWGVGPAGGFAALAVRSPDRVGFVDELGPLTFGDLERRATALADALREAGVEEGDGVAIMARNHRGFLDATLAGAKLGAELLFLNTAFAGPELRAVLQREAPRVLVHDEEFGALLAGAPTATRIVAWADTEPSGLSLEALIAHGDPRARLRPPARRSRIVILTSGTTGTARGALRRDAGLGAAVALLSRMPLRRRWVTHVATPLFHSWGLAHLLLAMLLESQVVVRRRFDPEACLEAVQQSGATSLVVVPVMLQRILALPRETLDSYDLAALEVVAVSGSALPGDLSDRWMDRFGEHLYNVYGSTEVAYATVATPRELREAPGTAGRPPRGTVVRVLDDAGHEVRRGSTGRIFVGNDLLFDGYTGGGRKAVVQGLMSTGDLGHLDAQGRLFVEGREDDMIVSGGENVFPSEVEDCLARHEGVREAAAVGVADQDRGARLRAFVVLEQGSEIGAEDLQAHVGARLARFKVPSEIVFVDALRRNATGKVLKRQLVEP